MKTKKCYKCKKNRLVKFFSKSITSNDGLHRLCKRCDAIRARVRWKETLEKEKKDPNLRHKRLSLQEESRKRNYYKTSKPYFDEKYKDPKYRKYLRMQRLKQTKTLTDGAVRSALLRMFVGFQEYHKLPKSNCRIPMELIPNQLIELKRIQLKIYRELFK